VFRNWGGRPRELKKGVKLNAYIEEEQLKAIYEIARKEYKSVSEVVRELIDLGLKQKGKLKEDKKESSEEEDERERRINENLKIMYKAKLETILDDIQKNFQKSLILIIRDRYGDRQKTLDEVLNLVEKDRMLLKEYWVVNAEYPNCSVSLLDHLIELRKTYQKYMLTVEKVITEAEQKGLEDTLEKASSLGGTLGNYVLRITNLLKQ